jgi:hypothetical protein
MMGFDINGTTLTSNTGLVATNASNQVMKMGPTGVLQRYNAAQPMFRTSGNGTGWVGIGTNGWALTPAFNLSDINIGSCYNLGNTRFTAPTDGIYLMTGHCYLQIESTGGYSHPMFWVNGTSNGRRPSAGALHRMKGHGIEGTYSVDSGICEMLPLLAGDYVEYRHFCGAGVYHLPVYGRLEGYKLF